ncbi:MAG TPA: ABC transporter ATP-binding protein [Gemmatimonadales bacterium]|nr:ABC transporter ATP-binding protein [Gemmatimonadales bacterium]
MTALRIEMQHASPSLDPVRPTLELQNVSKRFGRNRVLDQVSLEFRAGRVSAILGPNAAGKSTAMKIILGLVRPDSGRVLVNSMPVGTDPQYRSTIGYMPQNARFPDNLTGHEVVAMLRDLRSGLVPDDRLFQELELTTQLRQPIRTLSVGTRQKLNAAIAFMFRPSLLILDEPTASLDPVASNVLKTRISESRNEGCTVVLTSHVLAEVEDLADDVILLLEGKVAFAGTLRHLRQMTGEPRLERAVACLMKRAAP